MHDHLTAIDIALEPDATMVQHAMAANARLLKAFPKGFALDEAHHPHITGLQQFVRTDDLDKAFAAANAVMAKEKPTAWTLKAFKYYYIPSSPLGLAGIVVEPTEDLHRLSCARISTSGCTLSWIVRSPASGHTCGWTPPTSSSARAGASCRLRNRQGPHASGPRPAPASIAA